MERIERNRLMAAATDKNREGELEQAFSLYLEALKIDRHHAPAYVGLARTSYLRGDRFAALRGYLAAMHLQIHAVERQLTKNPSGAASQEFKTEYETLDSKDKLALPHQAGFILFYDGALARHAAHAFFDLCGNYPELKKYGQVYRAEVRDNDTVPAALKKWAVSETDYRIKTRDFYIPKGQEFFLQVIQWAQIKSPDVLNIYFRSSANNPTDILLCVQTPGLTQAV